MSEEKKRHEWILEGIDCANCASKIENGVSKIAGVTNSNANYMTKTLSFDVDKQKEKNILPIIKLKINKLEPDVTLLSKSDKLPIGKNGLPTAENKETSQLEEPHHPHEHSHVESNVKKTTSRLVISLVLLLVANFVPMNELLSLGLFVVAYLVAGYDVVWRAIKNMFNGQLFDENFLMTIATISAFYIQEYPEAVAVMLFYQVGEIFQGVAVNRSRRSIADLMDIRPDYANLKLADGNTKSVAPDTIRVGDTIVIRPGEKVPLDGKIVTGTTSMDTSALTGESVPRSVAVKDSVLSGFINKNGLIEVEVEKLFSESTVTKILDLVENASSRKAPTENFITKFARYYTPAVVIMALILAIIPPLVFPGATFNEWIYRASIFLVISCPCALVVSIPVGFFGGIGSASQKGILVKGSNFLEGLNDIKYVIMDKTGTLTKGKFEITDIQPENGWNKHQLLELAAYAETHSSHPIAESIKEKYEEKIDENRITEYNDISGHGIQVKVDGKEVLAGNAKLMQEFNISFRDSKEIGTIIYLAVAKKYVGHILIADAIKEDAAAGIALMKEKGVEHVIMLTGDSKAVGEAVAKKLGIDEFYAELLPQDKVEKMEEIMARKGPKEKVAFVGDGINDTPVLARSDIGIAMGGLGSDAAIEAADIVIMDDKPSKIGTVMQVAKDTRRIVWQNIILALAVKGFFLILGAVGIATMWEAVFADVGVTVIAVLNAMRVLKK
ncbi:heavy metal translocating P-type ATPase [Carnobacterium jeotgali]|uniref:heavy metal translocating P-type ATPase n=1 Tax=Carnobacterium jeotgali TaxID=545534 RepID=UPI0004936A04|nr:heavy metal translocating P-type ATPase [Carnobacterium jeotgali]